LPQVNGDLVTLPLAPLPDTGQQPADIFLLLPALALGLFGAAYNLAIALGAAGCLPGVLVGRFVGLFVTIGFVRFVRVGLFILLLNGVIIPGFRVIFGVLVLDLIGLGVSIGGIGRLFGLGRFVSVRLAAGLLDIAADIGRNSLSEL